MLGKIKTYFQQRSLERFWSVVREANGLSSEFERRSFEELLEYGRELKKRSIAGESRENLLPEAFALVRETAFRTLKQRPYDVQLLGSAILNSGAVAEMSTGEGKTLSAVPAVYLNALSGEGVHVVTVNEYLARRDAVWMGQIYNALGLSVACLVPQGAYLYDPNYTRADENQASNSKDAGLAPGESELADKERDTTGSFLVQQEYLRPVSRREAYLADITYGTNHEFGFDYLRDNLVYNLEAKVQREHAFAVIDEVDSILIDEARTPLIISAPDTESSDLYKVFTRVVSGLKAEEDYTIDEKKRTVSITEQGIAKVEKIMNVPNMYATENLRMVRYLEECLRAKALFRRDKDYVVKDGEIIIVDEFTGRMLQGRRYQGGLHQAIEAKEGVEVKQESRTYAKISIQNYFRLYKKISGMTGTAQTSAEEFHKVYGLEVYTIPTNRPCVRDDRTDVIYKNFDVKLKAIVKDIAACREKGQPVLVGTTSIAKNEIVSEALFAAGIPHEVLNAKKNEQEGGVIAQAGRRGAVTVATNMAGRGVDIILGGNPADPEEAAAVRAAGGLHVIGTERHEARRIDNQLRGRAGRQGDPGSSQFYLSLDDDLLRIFGGDRIQGMMEHFNLPEDEPIRIGFVSKAVQEAQAKVEGANFDLRKHLLDYDDVLNKQRAAVYKMRQNILASISRETLSGMIFEAAVAAWNGFWNSLQVEQTEESSNGKKSDRILSVLKEAGITDQENQLTEEQTESEENVLELLKKRSEDIAKNPQTLSRLLYILDMLWMNHLDELEAVSESVGLRAYGQRDPLVEYRQEASRLYKMFWATFNEWVFGNVFKSANQAQGGQNSGQASNMTVNARPNIAESPQAAGSHKKVGPNEPCPCGAKRPDGTPVKYKKCHGR